MLAGTAVRVRPIKFMVARAGQLRRFEFALFKQPPAKRRSSAAELQLYLEFAASALKKTAIALNYRCC
jgi:hypothetical protein